MKLKELLKVIKPQYIRVMKWNLTRDTMAFYPLSIKKDACLLDCTIDEVDIDNNTLYVELVDSPYDDEYEEE